MANPTQNNNLPPGLTLLPLGLTLVPKNELPEGLTLEPGASDASEKPAAPARTTRLERIGEGLRDPIQGTAQLAAHLLPFAGLRKTIDKRTAQREQAIQKANTEAGLEGTDWYRVLGSLGNPLAFAVPGGEAATISGLLARGALSGAAGALQQPVTDRSTDYWSEKGLQGLEGAGAGTLGNVIGKTARAAVAPVFGKNQQKLLDAGVRLTPGQLSGGPLQYIEDSATSWPFVRDFIRSGKTYSLKTFNQVAINDVLSSINEKLPKNIDPGREAIAHVKQKIQDNYNQLILPNMSLARNEQLTNDLNNIRNQMTGYPDSVKNQVNDILDNVIFKKFEGGKTVLSGGEYKEVETKLNHLSRGFKNHVDSHQRFVGDMIEEMQDYLRTALAVQNPKFAPLLKNNNLAWAKYKILQKASTQSAASDGVISPMNLATAVQSGPGRKAQVAVGKGLMQGISDPAVAVLPSKVPDSGTAGRYLLGAMLGGGGATGNLPLALAATVPALAYTTPGMEILNFWAKASPKTRQGIRKSIEKYGSSLGFQGGALSANIGTQQVQDQEPDLSALTPTSSY